MHAFESLRKPRAAFATEMARVNMRSFHLPDGPEQEARDSAMLTRKMSAPPRPEPRMKQVFHEMRLDDFEAPADVKESLKANGRRYIMDYDVVEHVSSHLNGQSTPAN